MQFLFFLKTDKFLLLLFTFSSLFLLLRKKEATPRFHEMCKVWDLNTVSFFLRSKSRETLVAFSYFYLFLPVFSCFLVTFYFVLVTFYCVFVFFVCFCCFLRKISAPKPLFAILLKKMHYLN